jgi:hypothetical protein
VNSLYEDQFNISSLDGTFFDIFAEVDKLTRDVEFEPKQDRTYMTIRGNCSKIVENEKDLRKGSVLGFEVGKRRGSSLCPLWRLRCFYVKRRKGIRHC